MDKRIVVGEESHRRNESLASLVQINSIAIDINCAVEEIVPPKHEHFTIRGFVSEMRKKNRKTCYPFASEGQNNDDGDLDLPPLSVPKFRWWQCPNCVPELVDQRSTLDMILANTSNVVAGENRCLTRKDGEEEGLLIQNIGDEKIIPYNMRCADGYNPAANIRTTEVGTSRPHITEANPAQIVETREESSDASDKVNSDGNNPSTKPDEPEKASSGSDDAIAYSALPYKRKPKLRSLADIINKELSFPIEQHRRTKSLSSSHTEDDSNSQPLLEVSSDAAKNTKTPLRKRKNIVLEDEGGPLETSPPNFTAKKLKSSILEAENISNSSKRLELSETDSDRDGPAWPDVRITAKPLPSKARKQKAFEINRKTRRPNVENRTAVQMMSNSSLANYANPGTSFGNFGNYSGPLCKKSVSRQGIDGFNDLPKVKRPEYVSLSESGLGDCAIRDKVALDLSLNSYMSSEMNAKKQESSGKYTGIPDLNESFVDKTNVMEGQQVPDFSELRSFAVHENLDLSEPSSKIPAREGKSSSGLLEQHQAAHNMYYNNPLVERGPSSDDIPMEIVELLAKNQHDKALDNSRKHLGPDSINNSFRRAHYVENTRGPFNFPYYANPRTGLSVTSGGNMGHGHGFLNFPNTKNCRLDKTQFRHWSSVPLYPGPNHMSGPKPREGANDLLWPPRRKNVTFDLTGIQSNPVQSNGLDDQSYQSKKAFNDESLHKEGKIGPGRMAVGPMDAYTNETIPAMQLLSLMDQGIVSGSGFKVGSSNFLDRPFSPCNHHPRLNKNDSQTEKFVGSSLFGKSSNINDFPALLNGARFSGESSKKSFSPQVQMPPPHKGISKALNLAGQHSRSDLRLEICTLNRNPADFSIPDAKNEFMISAKDLKPKKRSSSSSKDKSRPANMDGPKRQRARKDSSIKKAREINS
ncbi:Protein EMBRYONIC FLOWER 1 [Striga hermonthica]|uniref:Protein EMBRYONIC FLOWER 1 n=1 Tax=Striga hermonthica TaxID=68872 RepID=A0A9N7RRC1_STRHE|nr:Protein EMBRYONIC FLOWER 1 [Striga hermonthica]